MSDLAPTVDLLGYSQLCLDQAVVIQEPLSSLVASGFLPFALLNDCVLPIGKYVPVFSSTATRFRKVFSSIMRVIPKGDRPFHKFPNSSLGAFMGFMKIDQVSPYSDFDFSSLSDVHSSLLSLWRKQLTLVNTSVYSFSFFSVPPSKQDVVKLSRFSTSTPISSEHLLKQSWFQQSISFLELEQVSLSQCPSISPEVLTSNASLNETPSVKISSRSDSPESISTPNSLTSSPQNLSQELNSLQQVPRVNHSLFGENEKEALTLVIASPSFSNFLGLLNQSSLSSKTFPDCLIAQSDKMSLEELFSTSPNYFKSFNSWGILSNGEFSHRQFSLVPGLENDCFWLRSPGALSTINSRPPGSNLLESQLRELGMIEKDQVSNPEFLETAFGLPSGWTDPTELRPVTQLLEKEENASEMLLTQELQQSPLLMSSISPDSSPSNEDSEPVDIQTECIEYEQIVHIQPTSAISSDINFLDFSSVNSLSSEDLEAALYINLEAVSLGFIRVGNILRSLEDKNSKGDYVTFADYVRETFNLGSRQAYYFIGASVVYEQIADLVSPLALQNLRESHCRKLSNSDLTASQRREIWQDVEEDFAESGKLRAKDIDFRIRQRLDNSESIDISRDDIGNFYKVSLNSSNLEGYKSIDNSIVKLIDVRTIGCDTHVKLSNLFGKVFVDGDNDKWFSSSEIKPLLDGQLTQSSVGVPSLNLPLQTWVQIGKRCSSLEDFLVECFQPDQ